MTVPWQTYRHDAAGLVIAFDQLRRDNRCWLGRATLARLWFTALGIGRVGDGGKVLSGFVVS